MSVSEAAAEVASSAVSGEEAGKLYRLVVELCS